MQFRICRNTSEPGDRSEAWVVHRVEFVESRLPHACLNGRFIVDVVEPDSDLAAVVPD